MNVSKVRTNDPKVKIEVFFEIFYGKKSTQKKEGGAVNYNFIREKKLVTLLEYRNWNKVIG
jgi:hypothetical protein